MKLSSAGCSTGLARTSPLRIFASYIAARFYAPRADGVSTAAHTYGRKVQHSYRNVAIYQHTLSTLVTLTELDEPGLSSHVSSPAPPY